MGMNFVFVYFSFCFFFHAKTAPKNNHRRELSDLSFKNSGKCHSNDIKKLRKSFTGVEKNRFQIFVFASKFEQIKLASTPNLGMLNFHFTRLKLVLS